MIANSDFDFITKNLEKHFNLAVIYCLITVCCEQIHVENWIWFDIIQIIDVNK